MKVLIVEDNISLLENMTTFLSKEGTICEGTTNFNHASEKIHDFQYDVIVLDIMLPDGNGLELVESIKTKQETAGILIISAKNSLNDRVSGLNLGADDYLTKPFHLVELNARIKALYRRKHHGGSSVITFNEIRVNTDSMEVKVASIPIALTRKEYELLLFLLANKNRVITKQTIAEHLWGDYMDIHDSFDFVYQHIKNLRKKITKAGGADYLSTIYGMGYRFNTTAE